MKCIKWEKDHIRLIDQTRLPRELEFIDCRDVKTLGGAIRRLSIRGAPALGIAAAMGMALSAVNSKAQNREELIGELEETKKFIASTRPTAVNLFWALERMMKTARTTTGGPDEIRQVLIDEADRIFTQDQQLCRAIGDHGATLVEDGFNILHHCNTGFLATGDYGTALGVIRSAHNQGKKIHVWVDETRPLLQGARLTAWELSRDGIPHTVIADNMAGWLMQQGKVDMVVLGADRITASGDVANKIGTYSLAVLANHHDVPFYCAAPTTTIDMSITSGDQINIEQRNPDEVTYFQGAQSAPIESPVYNPAFDVTPHHLVTAIITEAGVIRPPYEVTVARLFHRRAGAQAI